MRVYLQFKHKPGTRGGREKEMLGQSSNSLSLVLVFPPFSSGSRVLLECCETQEILQAAKVEKWRGRFGLSIKVAEFWWQPPTAPLPPPPPPLHPSVAAPPVFSKSFQYLNLLESFSASLKFLEPTLWRKFGATSRVITYRFVIPTLSFLYTLWSSCNFRIYITWKRISNLRFVESLHLVLKACYNHRLACFFPFWLGEGMNRIYWGFVGLKLSSNCFLTA